MPKFYAAYNSYGISFTYDSDGWIIKKFVCRGDRDDWVKEDDCPNGNPTREKISAKTARKYFKEEM